MLFIKYSHPLACIPMPLGMLLFNDLNGEGVKSKVMDEYYIIKKVF